VLGSAAPYCKLWRSLKADSVKPNLYYLTDLFRAYAHSVGPSPTVSPALEHFSQNILGFEKINSLLYRHSLDFHLLRKNFDHSNSPSKFTVFFDLDETLIHCSDEERFVQDNDSQLIAIRPGVIEMLTILKQKKIEVGLFTSSRRDYAEKVLQILDPHFDLFSIRLYRENCVKIEGVWVKDLRVMGDNTNKFFLVDNNLYCSALNLQQHIPILSFTGCINDGELDGLQVYLGWLCRQQNPSQSNANYFGHDLLSKYLHNVKILPQVMLSRILEISAKQYLSK